MGIKKTDPRKKEVLEEEYHFLSELTEKLKSSFSYEHKKLIIEAYPQVKLYLAEHPLIASLIEPMPIEKKFIFSAVILIGQEHIFEQIDQLIDRSARLSYLLSDLWQVESFYRQMGGIVGYQKMMLELMLSNEKGEQKEEQTSYEAPALIDLSKNDESVRKAIVHAIIEQKRLAECYPVGGAGDRLNLRDEKGNGLPAARLKFLGRTLLEGMMRDLAAREYLGFKIHNEQVHTPILLMTSREKDNHNYVRLICNQRRWFGRKKSSFFFITQPLVPACDELGKWVTAYPLNLICKPNGHGALLYLAKQKGGYNWIEDLGRDYLFFRQVNNPVAATDNGLLAFIGFGYLHSKEFGFASCDRLPGTKEGMNVIKKIIKGRMSKVALSNIEYCDMKTEDLVKQGGKFPANTNMLLMKLEPLRKAVDMTPFPGLLINYKPIEVLGKKINMARLESTMQNIADSFEQFDQKPIDKKTQETLKAYITVNSRKKTLSAIKKSFTKVEEQIETPEACYMDILANAKDLLENYCQFAVPELIDLKTFMENGPSFLFFYHPALGPIYDVIGQKIKKGILHKGAEVQLEIADIDIEDLEVSGSLIITTSNVMGHFDQNQELIYSNRTGKCQLHHVKIQNKGLIKQVHPKFWKNRWKREESVVIELGENAEFIAKNVVLRSSHHFQVPSNYRFEIYENDEGKLECKKTPLNEARELWHYEIAPSFAITLKKQQS